MRLTISILLILSIYAVYQVQAQQPDVSTPVAIPSETLTPTLTETATVTPSETSTPTWTETATATPSETLTPTLTETATASETPEPMLTETPAMTPSEMATLTETPGETATSTPTPEHTLEVSETPTPTAAAFELILQETFDDSTVYQVSLSEGWLFAQMADDWTLYTVQNSQLLSLNPSINGNFILEVQMQLNEGGLFIHLPDNHRIGLAANGDVTLLNAENLLLQTSSAPFSPGTWKTIQISSTDGLLQISLDGAEVIQWQELHFAGNIQFESLDGQIEEITETYFLALDNLRLWLPVNFTPTPTETPTITETATSSPTTTPEPVVLESDDVQVTQTGAWTFYQSEAASGGGYLYSSGSVEDSLILQFSGSWLEVIFVEHPELGSFAIEIDGQLLQTITSTSENATLGKNTRVDNLTQENHSLKIYSVAGVVAIDAFRFEEGATPEVIFVSLEGQAVYQNHLPDNAGITISVFDTERTLLKDSVTDASGVYTVETPAEAAFWLVIDAPAHRPFEILLEPGQPLPPVMLAGGDLNDDGCINAGDIDLLRSDLALETASLADIDGNGLTDAADLAILTGNFTVDCIAVSGVEEQTE